MGEERRPPSFTSPFDHLRHTQLLPLLFAAALLLILEHRPRSEKVLWGGRRQEESQVNILPTGVSLTWKIGSEFGMSK